MLTKPHIPTLRHNPAEYAFKAVRTSGLTSVGVRGKDTVVVATQKKVQDRLIDDKSVTHIFPVAKHIGVCMTGLIGDAKAAVQRARQEAAQFEYENGYPIPVSYLAQKMANVAQLWTQQAFMRALGVVAIYFGVDDSSDSPQLYRVDPAGHYCGYKAWSAGVKEQDAGNFLEKGLKKSDMSAQATLELAVRAIQLCHGGDLKASDIEIAMVKTETGRYKALSETEIDQVLSSISEQD